MGADFAEHYDVARDTFCAGGRDPGLRSVRYLLGWSGGNLRPDELYAAGALRQQHGDMASAAGSVAWRETGVDGRASLGELSALTAAGALSFEAGVRLVQARGHLCSWRVISSRARWLPSWRWIWTESKHCVTRYRLRRVKLLCWRTTIAQVKLWYRARMRLLIA